MALPSKPPAVKGKSRALALMNEAKVTKRANFFRHCMGRAVILKVREYAPDDDPIPRFRIDFKILNAEAQSDSFDKKTGAPIPPHKEGELVSFIAKLAKKSFGPQNAKAAVLALFGADDETTSKEEYEQTYMELIGCEFDEAKSEWVEKGLNPARGMVIDFKSWWKQLKDKDTKALTDKWISNVDFVHVEQSEEEIAAMRSSLGEEEAPGEDEEGDE